MLNSELLGSFLGVAYRVVRVRRAGAGGTIGRHDRPREDVAWVRQRASVVTRKMNERRTNVIENKAPLWKTRRRSRNVYENKGT